MSTAKRLCDECISNEDSSIPESHLPVFGAFSSCLNSPYARWHCPFQLVRSFDLVSLSPVIQPSNPRANYPPTSNSPGPRQMFVDWNQWKTRQEPAHWNLLGEGPHRWQPASQGCQNKLPLSGQHSVCGEIDMPRCPPPLVYARRAKLNDIVCSCLFFCVKLTKLTECSPPVKWGCSIWVFVSRYVSAGERNIGKSRQSSERQRRKTPAKNCDVCDVISFLMPLHQGTGIGARGTTRKLKQAGAWNNWTTMGKTLAGQKLGAQIGRKNSEKLAGRSFRSRSNSGKTGRKSGKESESLAGAVFGKTDRENSENTLTERTWKHCAAKTWQTGRTDSEKLTADSDKALARTTRKTARSADLQSRLVRKVAAQMWVGMIRSVICYFVLNGFVVFQLWGLWRLLLGVCGLWLVASTVLTASRRKLALNHA